jgi:hypothetical protein
VKDHRRASRQTFRQKIKIGNVRDREPAAFEFGAIIQPEGFASKLLPAKTVIPPSATPKPDRSAEVAQDRSDNRCAERRAL